MAAIIIPFEACNTAPPDQVGDDALFAVACRVIASLEWTSLARSERSFDQLIKAMATDEAMAWSDGPAT
jgi:hypothetical protein